MAATATAPVKTIDDVIARMRVLDAKLPEGDGVLWFNRLYLSVTESVKQSIDAGAFPANRFLERLDVVFARLYFKAVDAAAAKQPVPKAWEPLFGGRKRRDVAPIQFALCGMNAHINHDLPLALVQTARGMKLDLRQRSPEHRAYLSVNAILAETEKEVKQWFATGFVGVVDEALGNVDDVIAIWNVARARDQAWIAGETLQAIHDITLLRKRFLLSLGRMVGFAGRGLLVPTC